MRVIFLLQIIALTISTQSETPCCGILNILRNFMVGLQISLGPLQRESDDPNERLQRRLSLLMQKLETERIEKIQDGRGAFIAPTEFRPSQIPLEGFDSLLEQCDGFKTINAPSNPVFESVSRMTAFRRYIRDSTDFWEIYRENPPAQMLQKLLESSGQLDTIIDPQAFVEMTRYLDHFFDLESLEHGENLPHEKLSCFGVFLYTAQREKGGPYKRINDALKMGKVLESKESLQKEVAMVHYGFTYLTSLEQYAPSPTCLLWRGMQSITQTQFDSFVTFQDFTWASYVSTSEDIEQAQKFCRVDPDNELSELHPNSVLFCIHFLYSHYVHAIKLESFSSYAEEKEVLFAPFCRFFVMGKEPTGCGRGIVHLQYDGYFPENADWREPDGTYILIPDWRHEPLVCMAPTTREEQCVQIITQIPALPLIDYIAPIPALPLIDYKSSEGRVLFFEQKKDSMLLRKAFIKWNDRSRKLTSSRRKVEREARQSRKELLRQLVDFWKARVKKMMVARKFAKRVGRKHVRFAFDFWILDTSKTSRVRMHNSLEGEALFREEVAELVELPNGMKCRRLTRSIIARKCHP